MANPKAKVVTPNRSNNKTKKPKKTEWEKHNQSSNAKTSAKAKTSGKELQTKANKVKNTLLNPKSSDPRNNGAKQTTSTTKKTTSKYNSSSVTNARNTNAKNSKLTGGTIRERLNESAQKTLDSAKKDKNWQARHDTSKNPFNNYEDTRTWGSKAKTKKEKKAELDKAFNTGKNTNSLGTTVETKTGGSKKTLEANLDKVASRAGTYARQKDMYSDPDKLVEASRTKRNGKPTLTKEQAKAISEYYKGLSQEEKKKLFKEEYGKSLKENDKQIDEYYKSLDSTVTSKDPTMEAYNRLVVANRIANGSDLTAKAMGEVTYKRDKNGKILYDEDENPIVERYSDYAQDIASRTAFDYTREGSRGVMGAIEGLSYGDNTNAFRKLYTEQEKNAIREGEQSGSYLAGNLIGQGINYAIPSGVGASLGKTLAKNVSKSYLKAVGAEALGQTLVNTPLNALDAYKRSTDVDSTGLFDGTDPNQFFDAFALNTAMDFGLGALFGGAGAILKKGQVKKALTIQNKLQKGYTLLPDEVRFLEKLGQRAETGYNEFDRTVKETKEVKRKSDYMNSQKKKAKEFQAGVNYKRANVKNNKTVDRVTNTTDRERFNQQVSERRAEVQRVNDTARNNDAIERVANGSDRERFNQQVSERRSQIQQAKEEKVRRAENVARQSTIQSGEYVTERVTRSIREKKRVDGAYDRTVGRIREMKAEDKAHNDTVANLEKTIKAKERVLKRKNLKPETRKLREKELREARKALAEEHKRYTSSQNPKKPKPKKVVQKKKSAPKPSKYELHQREIEKARKEVERLEKNVEALHGKRTVFRQMVELNNAKKALAELEKNSPRKPSGLVKKDGMVIDRATGEIVRKMTDAEKRVEKLMKNKSAYEKEIKELESKGKLSPNDKRKLAQDKAQLEDTQRRLAEARKAVKQEAKAKPEPKPEPKSQETPKTEPPKTEPPKAEKPTETPAEPKVEEPVKQEIPKAETPKTETPKKKEPVTRTPLEEARYKRNSIRSGAEKYKANVERKYGDNIPQDHLDKIDKMFKEAEEWDAEAKRLASADKEAKTVAKRDAGREAVQTAKDFIESEHFAHTGDPKKAEVKEHNQKMVEFTDKSNDLFSRFWQFIGDELSPYERLANLVAKTDYATATKLRSSLNRMRSISTLQAMAVTGKSAKNMGQVNWEGKMIEGSHSVREIKERAGLNGKRRSKISPNSSTMEMDYDQYCRLVHNLEMLKAGDEAAPFKFSHDKETAIATNESIIKEYEEAYGDTIKQYQQDVVKFFDNDLQYGIDGGLIDPTQAKWFRRYKNYIPLHRVDNLKTYSDFEGVTSISTAGAMRRRKGSDKDFAPLEASMMAHNAQIMKRTEQNNMLQLLHESVVFKNIEFEEMTKSVPDEDIVELIDHAVFIDKGKKAGYSKASFFETRIKKDKNGNEIKEKVLDENGNVMKDENGNDIEDFVYESVQVNIQLPNDAVKALKSWSGEEQLAFLKWRLGFGKASVELKTILRGFATVNRLFKDLITGWNPIFGAKNVVRDTQTAMVNTQYGIPTYIRNYGRAIEQMFNNGELFKAYKESGGIYSTMAKDGKEGFAKLDKVNVLKLLENINNAMETAPRFAEFCASAEASAVRKGVSLEGLTSAQRVEKIVASMGREERVLAISESKEVTVNFARSGQLGKLLNTSFVPYFNPALQGMYKLGKTGVNAFQKSTADGIKYVAKLMMLGAGGGVLFEEIMRHNEDYQQLSSYTKNTYYCIPLGDGHFLKIPKARDLSAVGVPFEHIIRTAQIGTEDGGWKDAFMTSWEQVGASVNPLEDNILSPFARIWTGKNWYGEDIENNDDKLLLDMGKSELVWDANTSQVAIALGNMDWAKKMNLSPKRIDSVLDGYCGMLYDLGISQTALSAKEYGKLSPFINNFVVDSTVKNRNASDFYLASDEYYKTMQYYEEKGETNNEKYKEAKAWIREYSYNSSEVSKAMNKIQMDDSMNTKAKYKKLRELKAIQNKIQKAGMDGKHIDMDALYEVANVIGVNETFGDKTLMNKQSLGMIDQIGGSVRALANGTDEAYSKSNTFYDSWGDIKKSDAYIKANADKKKKIEEDFLAVYKATSDIERHADGSPMYADFTTVALATELTTKNADGKPISKVVKEVFRDSQYPSTKRKVSEYIESGGDMKSWEEDLKVINKTAHDLGYEYSNEMTDGAKTLALANEGSASREFGITGTSKRMNAGRWATDDGITPEMFDSWYKDHKFSQYTDAEEIEKAIENTPWLKNNDQMKAEMFGLSYGYFQKNTPWGQISPYVMDGDNALSGNGKSGGGRRGWGHRRRGRGGGSGGSKINDYQKWLKEHSTYSSSTKSGDSSLTEAFRKKQLKQLQASTGTYKTK